MSSIRGVHISIRDMIGGMVASVSIIAAFAPYSVYAEERLLAHSRTLGVEIYTDIVNGEWCSENVNIRLIANSKTFFEGGSFPSLIPRFAEKVLSDCPATKKLTITGFEKGIEKVVWGGTAQGSDWKPVSAEAKAANSQPIRQERVYSTPAEVAQEAPNLEETKPSLRDSGGPSSESVKQVAKLPIPKSPLGGDWVGSYECSTNKYSSTLSVYEVSGFNFKAVWEAKKQGNYGPIDTSRYYVDGIFDDLTHQISIKKRNDGQILHGRYDSSSINGKFDGKNDLIKIDDQNFCNSNDLVVLQRASTVPIMSHRVLRDADRFKVWAKEEDGSSQPWRVIGKAPEGSFRSPSCTELVDWAQSYPTDMRVRLFLNSQGMLRHFDDASTQRVFGSPAYYWVEKSNYRMLRMLAENACGRLNGDKGLDALRRVVEDWSSFDQIVDRRNQDKVFSEIAPFLATRGDETKDAITRLNYYNTQEKIKQDFSRRFLPYQISSDEFQAVLSAIPKYKIKLAAIANENLLAEIVSLPDTEASLIKLGNARAETISLFGEANVKEILPKIDEKRLAIAQTVLAAGLNKIKEAPRTADGMRDIESMASKLRERLKGKNGDVEAIFAGLVATLDAAEQTYRADAKRAMVVSAITALGNIPKSFDGLGLLQATGDELTHVVGSEEAGLLEPYRTAAKAKLGELGIALLPEFQKELDALPVAWSSVEKAIQLAGTRAAPFVGMPIQDAYLTAGKERADVVLERLAETAMNAILQMGGDDLAAIALVSAESKKAAQPFNGVEKGTALAERILETGRKRQEELVAAYIKREINAVAATPSTFDGIAKLKTSTSAIEAAVGVNGGEALQRYRSAVAEKIGDIGKSHLPEFRRQLDALPVDWSSIQPVRNAVASRVQLLAGTSAEEAFQKEGERRITDILEKLADLAIIGIVQVKEKGLEGVFKVNDESERAKAPFTELPEGELFAKKISDAGRKRQAELVDAFIPELTRQLRAAPVEQRSAIHLAASAAVLNFLSREKGVEVLKLRDLAHEHAVRIATEVCDKALSDSDIGDSEAALELLIGNEVGTVKQFACDLRKAGIGITKFETPSMLGSIFGGEKQYVLYFSVSDSQLQDLAKAAMSNKMSSLTKSMHKANENGRDGVVEGDLAATISQGFITMLSQFDPSHKKIEIESYKSFFEVSGVEDRNGSGIEIRMPKKIVFKEFDLGREKKSLVGVEFGDIGKADQMSVNDWREVSSMLAASGRSVISEKEGCNIREFDFKRLGKSADFYPVGAAALACRAPY